MLVAAVPSASTLGQQKPRAWFGVQMRLQCERRRGRITLSRPLFWLCGINWWRIGQSIDRPAHRERERAALTRSHAQPKQHASSHPSIWLILFSRGTWPASPMPGMWLFQWRSKTSTHCLRSGFKFYPSSLCRRSTKGETTSTPFTPPHYLVCDGMPRTIIYLFMPARTHTEP